MATAMIETGVTAEELALAKELISKEQNTNFKALLTSLNQTISLTPDFVDAVRKAVKDSGYSSTPVSVPAQGSLKLTFVPVPAGDKKNLKGYPLFSHMEFARLKGEGMAGIDRNPAVVANWKALGKEGQAQWKNGVPSEFAKANSAVAPVAPVAPVASVASVAPVAKPKAENKYIIFSKWASREVSYNTQFPLWADRGKKIGADWKAMDKATQEQWVADFKAGRIDAHPIPKKEAKSKKPKKAEPAPLATVQIESETQAEIDVLNQAIAEIPEEEPESGEDDESGEGEDDE